jgi:hypothetical protein
MTTVHEMYQALIKNGYTPKEAAKEAQARTGMSTVTGQPIKQRGPVHKTKRKWLYGEYDT